RHRQLDGAVHSDAGAALAECVPGRRHRPATRARAAEVGPCERRRRARRAGLAAMAQLRGTASLACVARGGPAMSRSWRPRACRRIDTALGPMLVALGTDGLAGLWFIDQRHFPATAGWSEDQADPMFDAVAAELDEYFRGRRR